MTPAREEAIADCKYAQSLGDTALQQHFKIWQELLDEDDEYDAEYHSTICEIEYRLNTPDCLLRGEK